MQQQAFRIHHAQSWTTLFPGSRLRGTSSFSGLNLRLTQRLLLKTAHGCPKRAHWFFCEVPQVKNQLYAVKPLAECKASGIVQSG